MTDAFLEHIRSAFNTNDFSDLTIACKGITYRLHRFMVNRSNYFRALLAWSSPTTRHYNIVIEDDVITDKAVDSVLRSFYGADLGDDLTADTQYAILAAATYFGADDACLQTIAYIVQHLSADNILECLAWADTYDHERGLFNGCMRSFLQNGSTVLADQMHLMPVPAFKYVLSHPAFWVSSEFARYTLLKTMINQLAAICPSATTTEQKREILLDLLHGIKTHSMSDDQLEIIRNDKLIPNPAAACMAGMGIFQFGVKISSHSIVTGQPLKTARSDAQYYAGSEWSVEVRTDKAFMSIYLFRDRPTRPEVFHDPGKSVRIKFALYVNCDNEKNHLSYSSSAGAYIDVKHGWGWKDAIAMDVVTTELSQTLDDKSFTISVHVFELGPERLVGS